MNHHPRVSVFLSSYNHEKFLRESIDSVLAQSFEDFELYIKDDASTDSSWEIIQSYQDPRIRAFRNPSNQYWGFNDAYPSLRGEYIAVQHSDDAWEPEKLGKQVAYLDENPNIGAVFSHVKVMGENSQPLIDNNLVTMHPFAQPNRARHQWLNHFFYSGNALCHPSMVIRRACHENIGLYRYGMIQLFDLDMWVRLCLNYDIYIHQEPLMRFRIRANQMNTSSPRVDTVIRHQFEMIQILKNYYRIDNVEELTKIFPDAAKHIHPEYLNAIYTLSMLLIENNEFPGGQLLGLETLFDLLNDPQESANLKKYYQLDTLKFRALCTSKDVFAVEAKNMVSYYSQSKSWKYTRPFRTFGDLLRKTFGKSAGGEIR